MKIRSILIDDEPRGISTLQKMLELFCPEVEVLATCLSPDDAIEKILLHKPDLIFLDIAMPGKNAFEMLEEIGDLFFEMLPETEDYASVFGRVGFPFYTVSVARRV